MKKFSIVAKQDSNSAKIEQKILCSLLEHDFIYDQNNPELVICVGGDGTLLYAVHSYLDIIESLKFIAIHTGTLGFFTDYTENEVDQCIEDITKGDIYELFTSPLIEATFDKTTVYALNEIRIENIMRTQLLDIYVDDEFFEKFKGNGICLSTQAGSSAYNRSLGGGVVDSGLSLLQLVEIAGIHDHQHRSLRVPYLLKDDRHVSFVCDDFSNAYLCFDHKYLALDNIKRVDCKMSSKKVTFVRYRKYSYLKRVRNLY